MKRNENIKIGRKKEFLHLAAATVLRQRGFEVYTLPDSGVDFLPHLVAYKGGHFYNVYLYENADEKRRLFTQQTKEKSLKYAATLNATVLTALTRFRTKN